MNALSIRVGLPDSKSLAERQRLLRLDAEAFPLRMARTTILKSRSKLNIQIALNALSIRVYTDVKETLLHGLFPMVRAELLRLLFTNRGQELYTRELARLSFLALRTVQDELAKLEAAHLIMSRHNGYQRFYRANPKHSLYPVLTELVRKGVGHTKPRPRVPKSRRP